MFKSLYRLQHVNLGFDPDSVLTMQVSLPRAKYSDPKQVTEFYDQTLKRVAALPGVKSAGAISKLPLTGTGMSGGIVIDGRPVNPSEQLTMDRRVITEDYFRTMSIPLKQGRFFTSSDWSSPTVVIINETGAKRYWNGENPVGRHLRFEENEKKWVKIVGVVGDVRQSSIEAEPKPELYIPSFYSPSHNMTVVAKLNSASTPFSASFRSEVTAVDKSQRNLLFKLPSADVGTYLMASAFFVVLMFVASLIPAWRASKLSPTVAILDH
jgi:putative ABC transport system permease protein